MTLQDDLLTLERGFWEAPGRPEFYEQHMADDGLVIFGFEGGIIDKASVIPTVTSAPAWQRYDIANLRALELTDDCAALVYTGTAQREGDAEYRANITSIYVRRSGAWKLALHQQTPIAVEANKPH